MKYRWYVLMAGLVLAGLATAWTGRSGAETGKPVPVSYPETEVTVERTEAKKTVGECLVERLPDIVPAAQAAEKEGSDVAKVSPVLLEPISGTAERVTKLPFGRFVAPGDSPVGSDRFRGYHSAIDLEILPGEEGKEVEVRTVCAGPLLRKTFATGYGGVVIQGCELQGDDITVVYGHLDLKSVDAGIGDTLGAGEVLGWLGAGESVETDGERKHLHLGIHRGSAVNFLGYVQRESELDGWIDPLPLIAP